MAIALGRGGRGRTSTCGHAALPVMFPRLYRTGARESKGPGRDRGPSWIEGCGQAPMRKTLLPHLGQTPCVAGLPFFIVILTGLFISTFILSLTQ